MNTFYAGGTDHFFVRSSSIGTMNMMNKIILTTKMENLTTEVSEECSKSNIIINHDFWQGLHMWQLNLDNAHPFVVSSESNYPNTFVSLLSFPFAVISNRKFWWQSLEQDITSRVSAGCTYYVCAWVGISSASHDVSEVKATLKLEDQNSELSFMFIGRSSVSTKCWTKNIIQNPRFDNGLNNWSGRGCRIVLHGSWEDGKVLPIYGKSYIATEDRKENYNGIQQEITGRVKAKLAYKVVAIVRLSSSNSNISRANIIATLWVYTEGIGEHYVRIASSQATIHEWVKLQGTFLLNSPPKRVIIYVEGPEPGTNILLNNLSVKLVPKSLPSPPFIESVAFGVNIIENSNLSNGTNGWFSMGGCTLTVIGNGSPRILPPMARDYLGPHEPLSGRYILVKDRTQTWMGPYQKLTHKIKPYLTYQVSAWVKIGNEVATQNIHIVLDVDGQLINGGQVVIDDNKWHEIGGSFRIENQPKKVMVYIQGPDIGVNFMVAEFQIFPVDRKLRFRHLKEQTNKVRKRDVILKFLGSPVGTFVKIKQTKNSFPFGTCVNRSHLTHTKFLDFFSKNFNRAVFENELKWNWTEPEEGNFNNKDADDLTNFCESHNIQLCGHYIYSEVEDSLQSWIHTLNNNDIKSAIQKRLKSLFTRYKGKFMHYDLNNEMLHGSFYQDHLGIDIRASMFKTANKIDPSATLFVNDYNIENVCCERYIEQILELHKQGAPVGGIGIQGHVHSPIGHIVCSALDKLSTVGLPIWFTEIDVSSNNEYVRADDLEVMLREAFAHPAVDGIMLWGFWELFMNTENAYLVNANGEVNEAGKRYLALKKEWLSNAQGHVNKENEFEFRGFHGTYEVEIVTLSNKKLSKTFVVDQGEGQLVVSLSL